jgi:hypothetical protein
MMKSHKKINKKKHQQNHVRLLKLASIYNQVDDHYLIGDLWMFWTYHIFIIEKISRRCIFFLKRTKSKIMIIDLRSKNIK